MRTYTIRSSAPRDLVDLTTVVESGLPPLGEGLVTVHLLGTGAAVTTVDTARASASTYLETLLDTFVMVSQGGTPQADLAAQACAVTALVGGSLTLPFYDGRLVLAYDQRLTLLELTGPLERQVAVMVQMMPNSR